MRDTVIDGSIGPIIAVSYGQNKRPTRVQVGLYKGGATHPEPLARVMGWVPGNQSQGWGTICDGLVKVKWLFPKHWFKDILWVCVNAVMTWYWSGVTITQINQHPCRISFTGKESQGPFSQILAFLWHRDINESEQHQKSQQFVILNFHHLFKWRGFLMLWKIVCFSINSDRYK